MGHEYIPHRAFPSYPPVYPSTCSLPGRFCFQKTQKTLNLALKTPSCAIFRYLYATTRSNPASSGPPFAPNRRNANHGYAKSGNTTHTKTPFPVAWLFSFVQNPCLSGCHNTQIRWLINHRSAERFAAKFTNQSTLFSPGWLTPVYCFTVSPQSVTLYPCSTCAKTGNSPRCC